MSFWLEYLQFRGYVFVLHPSTAPEPAPDTTRGQATVLPTLAPAAGHVPRVPPIQIRIG